MRTSSLGSAKPFGALALGALALVLIACQGGSGAPTQAVDPSDPLKVAEAVLVAARSDPEILKGFCDPAGENDADTKRICAMTKNDARYARFKAEFSRAAIVGAPRVSGNVADIDIRFSDGKRIGTLRLVQRDGSWYLARL